MSAVCGILDAQRVTEERGDREPVGEPADHPGLGRGAHIAGERRPAVALPEQEDDPDDRRAEEERQRHALHAPQPGPLLRVVDEIRDQAAVPAGRTAGGRERDVVAPTGDGRADGFGRRVGLHVATCPGAVGAVGGLHRPSVPPAPVRGPSSTGTSHSAQCGAEETCVTADSSPGPVNRRTTRRESRTGRRECVSLGRLRSLDRCRCRRCSRRSRRTVSTAAVVPVVNRVVDASSDHPVPSLGTTRSPVRPTAPGRTGSRVPRSPCCPTVTGGRPLGPGATSPRGRRPASSRGSDRRSAGRPRTSSRPGRCGRGCRRGAS